MTTCLIWHLSPGAVPLTLSIAHSGAGYPVDPHQRRQVRRPAARKPDLGGLASGLCTLVTALSQGHERGKPGLGVCSRRRVPILSKLRSQAGNEVGISPPGLVSWSGFAPPSMIVCGAPCRYVCHRRPPISQRSGEHREKGTRNPVHNLGGCAGGPLGASLKSPQEEANERGQAKRGSER